MADKLTLRQVAKTFEVDGGAVPVLQPFDLSVADGEFVTIVGPSGCGKSTLFNIVAGLLPSDGGGRLLIDGQAVASPLGQVAYMPQRDLAVPVADRARQRGDRAGDPGVARAEARRRALDVIGQFGLEGFADYYRSRSPAA